MPCRAVPGGRDTRGSDLRIQEVKKKIYLGVRGINVRARQMDGVGGWTGGIVHGVAYEMG